MIKKKILIAEDDKDIAYVLSLILEDAGYDVLITANEQTFEEVSTYLPNLLLLDIWMVGVDGHNICKYMKSQQITKNIPIIMISANNDTKRIAKEAGADDYIEKPFEMEHLLAKVASHLH